MALETANSCRPKLEALGCSTCECQDAAALPGLNWAALLALVQQYGPGILTLILSLFGKAPLPANLPHLKNPAA